MKLERLLLRYYPPGIGLVYIKQGVKMEKMLDLFDLTTDTSLETLCNDIMEEEPLITESVKSKLFFSLTKLQNKLFEDENQIYKLYHNLNEHVLPVTAADLNKEGSKCVTSSFDRTCKVWDVETGMIEHSLDGHTGPVFTVIFNNPYGDRIITGSFDKTACIWDADSGKQLRTLWGHQGEVVIIKYEPFQNLIATASTDKTVKIFDMETGVETWTLRAHEDSIIALDFSNDSKFILTASFDSKIFLWDQRSFAKVGCLSDHTGEITSCLFNYDTTLIGSGSADRSAIIWDLRNYKPISKFIHEGEISHVNFDKTGNKFATATNDGIVKIFTLLEEEGKETVILSGHKQDISKVQFSPGGGLVLTGSADGTCRLWKSETGHCVQVLSGHTDDVLDCSFSYDGSVLVSASKDSTCKIWKSSSN